MPPPLPAAPSKVSSVPDGRVVVSSLPSFIPWECKDTLFSPHAQHCQHPYEAGNAVFIFSFSVVAESINTHYANAV
jgi:hypothetical protein